MRVIWSNLQPKVSQRGLTAPKWAKSKGHGRHLVRFDRFCPLYTMEETRSLPSKPSWWDRWISQPPIFGYFLRHLLVTSQFVFLFLHQLFCAKFEIHNNDVSVTAKNFEISRFCIDYRKKSKEVDAKNQSQQSIRAEILYGLNKVLRKKRGLIQGLLATSNIKRGQ